MGVTRMQCTVANAVNGTGRASHERLFVQSRLHGKTLSADLDYGKNKQQSRGHSYKELDRSFPKHSVR
jgi:hypothetical protein